MIARRWKRSRVEADSTSMATAWRSLPSEVPRTSRGTSSATAHTGRNLEIGGLCDAGEEQALRRRLARAGYGEVRTREDLERLGFFVCDRDLEDEMIRALGVEAVEHAIDMEGELESLRIMQRQPAQRERPPTDQLRRFIGTRSGRKIRYGQLLAEALDLGHVPHPLTGVLDWVRARLPS